jgi:hypothetical protein
MAYKLNPFTGNFDQVLDKAAEIKYDNTTSGLTATNTQAAIDEVLSLAGGLTVTTVTTATHSALVNTIVLCNRAGTVAVTLPTPTANRQIVVKDISGAAETNTITVNSSSGNVDGSASQTITSNYGSLTFVGDGSNWWAI